MSKTLIVFDKDDTLFSLAEPFLEFVNEKYKSKITLDDLITFDFSSLPPFQELNINAVKLYDLFDEFYKTEYLERLEPLKGAVNLVENLKENYTLVCITASPELPCKPSTENLFSFYFDKAFSEIVYTRKKSIHDESKSKMQVVNELMKKYTCDNAVIIDDNSKNVLEVQGKNNMLGIIAEKNWSDIDYELPENVFVIDDLNQALGIINSRNL